MKFKSIFILFCVTLFLLLAVLVLFPPLMLGPSVAGIFWRHNWPLAAVWVALFAGFSVFYFINRRLFILLEKEDWPALVRYLEDRVVRRGQFSFRLVRLLANSYLVLSDSQAVMSLENKTAIVKPALVDANVLVFGTARILGGDIAGAVRFFETRRETVRAGFRDWTRWYHGFALLLDRRYEEAAGEFSLLTRVSKDGVISALSAWFLSGTLAQALPAKRREFQELAGDGKKRVLSVFTGRGSWNREISRLSTEIHAAALSRHLEETGQWLYGSSQSGEGGTGRRL